jgi:hypothetical protein
VIESQAIPVTGDSLLRCLVEIWATKWDGRWQLEARNVRFHNRNASNWPSRYARAEPVAAAAHG